VSDVQAVREIAGSRAALEEIIGGRVVSFCYPGGDFAPRHVGMVAAAGFRYARATGRRLEADLFPNYLAASTTVQAYRHWLDGWQILRRAAFRPGLSAAWLLGWDRLAMAVFDDMAAHGGTFHLWGHSWEIEQNGDWERLERVLAYISGRADVEYVTNGELV
jgi:peptidoglycan/xylan/chitin deacetylase (PgdA/CDA1 family)